MATSSLVNTSWANTTRLFPSRSQINATSMPPPLRVAMSTRSAMRQPLRSAPCRELDGWSVLPRPLESPEAGQPYDGCVVGRSARCNRRHPPSVRSSRTAIDPNPARNCKEIARLRSPVEVERQHYNTTLAILTLAGIAFALQQTMVIPALPTLQQDLHTTTTWVTWVLTVFLLVASVATPILGKLGDQYGKERVLVIALLIFLAGSVGAALAWNIWVLIAWRALQGAGAAVFPLSYGIIRDEVPREKVGVAIGLISAVFGIGGGFGIVLSGVIVDNVSWH